VRTSPLFQGRFDAWVKAIADFGPLLIASPIDHVALDRHRLEYQRIMALNPLPEGVTVSHVDMGGIPGHLVAPQNGDSGRVILYFHGGGYVAGGPLGHQAIAGHYAKLLGARVYIPDYRLAPEHPYPAPIDDAFASYRWLLNEGIDARSIAFSGDSAGGAMVVTVMVWARNAGLPLPAGGVAISPWANLEHTGASMATREGLDPQATVAGLNVLARAVLNGALPGDPDVSPVFADVRGLSPILVQIGENEVMLSDAVRLAEHLGNNRIRTSLEIWPGMFHVWHLFAADLDEGMEAMRNAAAFLHAQMPRD